MTSNQPNPQPNKPTLDTTIIVGFLYGIQSDLLSYDEIEHRLAGFRHTQGYKEAHQAIASAIEAIIGEDVKDYGRSVVRNDDGTEHSSSAGSYRDYCNNVLKAEQRQRATAYLNPKQEKE